MKLIINTAQAPFFYAFYEAKTCLFEHKWDESQLELEDLGPNIQASMDQFGLKQLEGILVIKGPGRFTSIRLGLSVAKAFASVLGAPLYGLGALEALILSYPNKKETCLLALQLKADQFYVALAGGSARSLFSEPILVDKTGLETLLDKSDEAITCVSPPAFPLLDTIKQEQITLALSSLALAELLDAYLTSATAPQPVVPNYVFEP